MTRSRFMTRDRFWHAEGHIILDLDGEHVATVIPLCDEQESLADAYLMAAAPDLLEACERLLTMLTDAWDELPGLVAGGYSDVNASADCARVAIAKAKGELYRAKETGEGYEENQHG